jgi:hypothetical protein
MRTGHLASATVAAAMLLTSCGPLAELGRIVQPPRFSEAPDRRAELRLLPPGPDRRAGGAGIRIWTEVENPNAFGLTIRHLEGELFLEEARAAREVGP